jgi:FlaA1/EpsC-like NDP-sugar epimerase
VEMDPNREPISRNEKSMIGRWLTHPRIAVVLHDLGMVWLAWTGVHWLRYLIWPMAPHLPWLPVELPIILACQAMVLYYTGLYRGIWRFASLPDLWNIMRASAYGTLLITLALFLYDRLEGVPRSVFLLYPVALIILLGTPRLLFRVWKDHGLAFNAKPGRIRVVILGAGAAGELLARDLRRDSKYYPVGFLDDQETLWGAKLRGLPVFGSIENLAQVASRQSIEMAIIAIPSASNQQMQRVVGICESSAVQFRTVPRMQDLVSGRAIHKGIKNVAIEDLLGREPVMLDWKGINRGLSGKSVLVTGGGGSIGGELCRQISKLGPARLIIVDNTEFNLYRIELELRREFPELILDAILGDVCEPVLVDRVLEQHQPELIFHTAAFKHVPLLETHVREALRNNVLGTRVLTAAADRHQVENFVLISTDKAVNPASLMGASKHAAEVVCQHQALHSNTHFITVRFGNVLNSAGSVVPLFSEQIDRGGPVTVTHPEVVRYFMTIPEACQLIMQVAAIGKSGGVYVLDMGEPVKIQYLAEQMIRLAGHEPGRDIEIVHTGLRPGEKLFEELFHEHEPYAKTEHQQIFQASRDSIDEAVLEDAMSILERAVRLYDDDLLLAQLHRLVPAYGEASDNDDDTNVVSINQG